MILIRKGNQADLPAIVQLLIRCWQINYREFLPGSFLGRMDFKHQLNRHTTYLNGPAVYFVAETGNADLVGFTSYGKNRSLPIEVAWELYTLYVDPDHQRRGIGQLLLAAIEGERQIQKSGIGVAVMEKNPCRSFYEQNGFRAVDREMMDLGDLAVNNIIYQK